MAHVFYIRSPQSKYNLASVTAVDGIHSSSCRVKGVKKIGIKINLLLLVRVFSISIPAMANSIEHREIV